MDLIDVAIAKSMANNNGNGNSSSSGGNEVYFVEFETEIIEGGSKLSGVTTQSAKEIFDAIEAGKTVYFRGRAPIITTIYNLNIKYWVHMENISYIVTESPMPEAYNIDKLSWDYNDDTLPLECVISLNSSVDPSQGGSVS